MSLRSKIILILSLVVTLYALFDNGALRMVAKDQFADLEFLQAELARKRAYSVYQQEERSLLQTGRVWAGREEIRTMVDGISAPGSGLAEHALDDSGVDVLYVCDASGRVLWGRIVDAHTGEAISLPRSLPSEALSGSHPLLNVLREEDSVSGTMTTERGPLLVTSTPIRGADGTALPPSSNERFRRALHGYVVLGRFLDDELRNSIFEASGVRLEIKEAEDLGQEERDIVARLTSKEAESVPRYPDDEQLEMFWSILDLRTGEPLVFVATMDRPITALGRRVVDYALVSTAASMVLILFVLLRLLQRIVLRPLSTLTDKAVEIGKTDDSTIRVGLERDDEIGTLATEFDRMLEELARSRDQLVKTARRAGMSEIATGVLHNVGNVLNSVNVSTNLLSKNVDRLALKDLQMMVDVLQKHEDDLAEFVASDPRGKHMLPLLVELSGSLEKQREELRGEIKTLAGGIDHIADLVRSQQTYAGTKGVFELASLQDEVDSALRMCKQAGTDMTGIEVERDYDELPTTLVDKHKLMEILVNLIQNAIQSMRQAGKAPGTLTLRIKRRPGDEEGAVRIEVQDTGVGISAENLARVFHHGFTTKEDGHGFGLHTSANAATEMNSSLSARSDGEGCGAVFYLDIPLRQTKELANAA